MALILDKTHTGVTSVDISGNTLTTGYTNLNYKDQFGNVYENPYLVIDNIIINKLRTFIKIMVTIYKDKENRTQSKEPFYDDVIGVNNQEIYNSYFSINVMEEENIFKVCYNYLKEVKFKGWKSDEV
jgi:hypothetical protein